MSKSCYLCLKSDGHEIGCPRKSDDDGSEQTERERFWALERKRLGLDDPPKVAPSPIVQTPRPIKYRTGWLAMSSMVKIPAGAASYIIARPQIPFRGRRLYIARQCSYFFLEDVRIGNCSMQPKAGAILAEPFLADTEQCALEIMRMSAGTAGTVVVIRSVAEHLDHGHAFDLEVAHPGTDIVMHVMNQGPTECLFIAAWQGDISR